MNKTYWVHYKRLTAGFLSLSLILGTVFSYPVKATENSMQSSVSDAGISVSGQSVSGEALSEDAAAFEVQVSSDDAISYSGNSTEQENESLSENDIVSANTVSEGAADEGEPEDIPFGAFDDDLIIDNPEPLDVFVTPATEREAAGKSLNKSSYSIMSLEEAAAASYAASYNSVAEGYFPDSLRHQGNSSLCWAFSAAALAEISGIKKNIVDRSVHYSEDQIGYFFFNHVTDPKGGTVNDSSVVKGSYNYFSRGGNNVYNVWNLASWASVRNHADMPFKNSPYTSSEVTNDMAYDSALHLQNAYWASTSSNDSDISYAENVKELVYNYGAASIIVYNGLDINSNHAVYGTTAQGGHNVTIIGWDDNFSASKFTNRPPGDGAWYVKDNYGTDGKRDENGCFWLSYYDSSIRRSSSKAIAFDFENGENYDNNYQYDGACFTGVFGFTNTKNLKAANVFTAKNNETLKAVGFAPASEAMDYEIRIYKLDSADASPESGQEVTAARTSGSTRYVGYRTIPLSSSVSIDKGQSYSVVVNATVSDGYAALYTDQSNDKNTWVTFTSSTSANQSYVKNGSSWTDMHTYGVGNRAFRIKAYTDDRWGCTASFSALNNDSYTFDGKEHKVSVNVVSENGEVMTEGTDYTVSYYNNINAGKASVKVTALKDGGINNDSYSFAIAPRTLSEGFAYDIGDTLSYNGSALEPSVSLSDNELLVLLTDGTDYNKSYSDNINAGTGYVTFYGKGNYTGSIRKSFAIEPKKANFEINSISGQTYTGSEITPSVTAEDPDLAVTLKEGVDFTVSYTNNVNAGTAKVILTGTGNYTGSVYKGFTVSPKSANCFLVSEIYSRQYTGKEICPEPVVRDANLGSLLSKGRDYTLSYKDNINEGNASIIVSGAGNYTGQTTKTFFISKAEEKELVISDIADQQFKPGIGEVKPALKVKCDNVTLVEGRDYRTVYSDNTKAGTAKVDVIGISKTIYDNSRASATYTINSYPVKNAVIEGIQDKLYQAGKDYSEYSYGINVMMKSVTTGQMITLTEGVDYTLTFDEATKVPEKAGNKVYYYINGIGNYTGSVRKFFTVRPYIPFSDSSVFSVSLDCTEFDYDGKAHKPGVRVVYYANGGSSGVTLSEGSDYVVTYASNKNAGRGRVTVKPSSSLKKELKVKGTSVRYFTINGEELKECSCKEIKDMVYNARAKKPSVAVYMSDGKRLPGSYYYVVYENNINAGTAKFTVYGKRNYSGILCSGTFNITPRSFRNVGVSYIYNRQTGAFDRFWVRYAGSFLREGIDYTVSDSQPDANNRITRTITPIEGRNFLCDKVKTIKYIP